MDNHYRCASLLLKDYIQPFDKSNTNAPAIYTATPNPVSYTHLDVYKRQDGGNVIVIVAVHPRLSGAAFGVPHRLQRVNDDQLGGGMLGQEIRDLLLQPAARCV